MEQVNKLVYLSGAVLAVLFWFFTIYGLPPRVDRLENAVADHDRRLAQSSVQLDTIADDVKIIKDIMLRRGGN